MSFVWGQTKRHPIGLATLRRPKWDGGINLFHAAARNDAQYLTWLGAYLAPAGSRPLWTFLADRLFVLAIPKKEARRVPVEARRSPFSQAWKPNARKLPFILRSMLRVAKKYHLAMDAPAFPAALKLAAPIWSHQGLRDQTLLRAGRPEVRCLKFHHAVTTVDDLEEIAEQAGSDHEEESDCACEDCAADRSEGCRWPHRCQAFARDVLCELAPKWSTADTTVDPPSDLRGTFGTHSSDDADLATPCVFDPRLDRGEHAAHYYRLFVHRLAIDGATAAETIQREPASREVVPQSLDAVTVYVAGALDHTRTACPTGGMGIMFPDGEGQDFAGSCPGAPHTHASSTALAVAMAVSLAPRGAPLHMVTRSRQVARMLTTDLRRHEDRGWMDTPGDSDSFRLAAAALRSRVAETTFTTVSKPALKEWPELKDTIKMAKVASDVGAAVDFDTDALAPFDAVGMAVVGITQREALRAIKHTTLPPHDYRRATRQNILEIQSSLLDRCDFAPTDWQVWTGLRSRDLSRGARNFLWRAIHGAHKMGAYFSKMPQPWKAYEKCATCGCLETLFHVLFECPDTHSDRIWESAQELLWHRGICKSIDLGTVLGCASVRLRGDHVYRDLAAERAFRIVVSETAFFLWKLRCEKRIQHAEEPAWGISDEDALARWTALLRNRISMDVLLSDANRFKNLALRAGLANSTWLDVENPANDDIDPSLEPGVLVGMGDGHSIGIG
ncbi:hypothetical protein AURDEDRAFT_75169 [Auricularia subglabra TFB-10046 SS5]|uniref:Reverse transcriptase zinc-binding domain-containing protein n=1 Tax=Auricularia subglabra (strain TFB-10046 / SS5) TaxID=717982 RepID=J0LF07_AURST|nr:hypothetical protein AURDEDRAFT_75169 [Auricularia subglabra TFB-10046 SS5]